MPRALHRVDRYARDVRAGRIVAGPYVRLACDRHLADREARRGWRFDATRADHAIGFIEKWVRLPDTVDADGDPARFVLQPWQAFIVGSLFGWTSSQTGHRRFKYGYIEVGKGNGKALGIWTPIATPDGWTTMGAIREGDRVFDERGRIVDVIGTSDVMEGHACYEVVFDDHSSIVADAEHWWVTETRRPHETAIHTTEEIRSTLRYPNGRYQSANHSIPLAGPLGTETAPLPIPPYVLGVWLGDGDSDCARITKQDADAEILEYIAAEGVTVGARQVVGGRAPRYRLEQTQATLRALGLLHHKQIPPIYLRASVDQRLALLQGLMDTDGYIDKRSGSCEFTTTTPALAEGAVELLVTLGIKVRARKGRARLHGREVSDVWRMQFNPPPDLPVFRLRRKLQYHTVRHARRRLAGDRRIVDVRPVPSVPVRCIAVNSPSRLYLAGRAMIPTHNTPLVAAIGLYGLTMDGCPSAQIYAAAADRDQAMILFRDAVRMVDASPELAKRIQKSGIANVHNLSYGSAFFRPFSREQGARSGTRPHFGLIDELHEHPTPEAVQKIRAGAKGDPEALFVEITNSGFDRTSICWAHHEQAIRILEGGAAEDGDRTFAYVCALDEGDDPLTDRRCHIKANPNLGVSIPQSYLDDQVTAARTIEAETNLVLRLNFCMWTQAISRAWAMDVWRRTGRDPVDPAALAGRPCYGGLDLGQTDDFTAWVRVWDLEDGRIAVLPRFWIPRAALEKYPNRPYAVWQRSGVLTITEGDTTDYDLVEAAILQDARASAVREIAYDKRFAGQLALHLQGAGLTVVDTAQGFGLTEAIRSVGKLVADGAIVHGGHPVLEWMFDNCALRTGRTGEVRLDKDAAKDKIDGAVAVVMAEDRRIHQPPPREKYQLFVLGA